MRPEPDADAILFVEVDKFHKIHQRTDTGTEDQAASRKLRNKRPFRIEVAEDVTYKTRQNKQNGVAVKTRGNRVHRKAEPPPLGDIRHFHRQPPDMFLDPRGDIGSRVFLQIEDPE